MNHLNIIVSSNTFAEFIKRTMFGEDYQINSSENRIHILDLQTDTTRSFNCEMRGQITGLEINYKSLKKLRRFLESIPNQPLNIIFDENGIECTNFVASFK